MNFLRHHSLKIGIFFAIIFIAVLFITMRSLGSPGDGSKKIDFEVKAGYGSIVVANQLYKKGLIRSRTAFKMYLRMTGNTKSIKRGIYPLNDGMSVSEVTDIITSGITKSFSITIPEGYHNRQIAERFLDRKIIKDKKEFEIAAKSQALLNKYKIAGESVEGYLFPDTYTFPIGYTIDKILDAMVKNFFQKTSAIDAFPSDPQKIHRLVILASIVEREAKRKDERATIAGVFANRLKKNYPLESCATIQYLFEKPKTRLYYYHLEMKSPYNTYKHAGLPPGPISNPGIEAIKAALNPEPTDYMFFVVKDDEGRHAFSKSLSEHNRAKKKYILH